jgi:biotin transporter BioY
MYFVIDFLVQLEQEQEYCLYLPSSMVQGKFMQASSSFDCYHPPCPLISLVLMLFCFGLLAWLVVLACLLFWLVCCFGLLLFWFVVVLVCCCFGLLLVCLLFCVVLLVQENERKLMFRW